MLHIIWYTVTKVVCGFEYAESCQWRKRRWDSDPRRETVRLREMTSKTQVAAWKGIVIWTKEKAVLHNPLNDKVVGKLRPLIHTWLQSALRLIRTQQ